VEFYKVLEDKMTATQSIAGLIPTGQSLAILSNTLPKKGKKPKIVKTGVQTIVGLSLLRSTASLAGSI
jgi:hypothetical protein